MDHLIQYEGKVRNVYKLGEKYLLMKATDRVSSFDRHIGIIPGKGKLLNKMSEFWFEKTRHIIDNHLIDTQDDVALVHKCEPFKIEVVVRGYIAGNTSTSLWTHYNGGNHTYCGLTFPNNLKKNQKLEFPVITPTTKGDVDRPLSKKEIVDEGHMTSEECNIIYRAALELFIFGQKIADKAGFILVDTKYEFGKNSNGQIILIDELHTCDSSRYWLKESYATRFAQGHEPEKLDKDRVRDWVKSKCDPYKDEIPTIPEEVITQAHDSYKHFYDTISKIEDIPGSENFVIILSGSDKDCEHVGKIAEALAKRNIQFDSFIASAHRNTRQVLAILEKFSSCGKKIVWVTVAGKSNALSGVVAANCKDPVIACPPFNDKTDMSVNLHSTLQCPNEVPVMTVLDPKNVALAIERIFS